MEVMTVHNIHHCVDGLAPKPPLELSPNSRKPVLCVREARPRRLLPALLLPGVHLHHAQAAPALKH